MRKNQYISPMSIKSAFLEHHIELSPQELDIFATFLDVFQQYNSHTNLSAIRDEAGIIEKHFIDSVMGASILGEYMTPGAPKRLLDIGSG